MPLPGKNIGVYVPFDKPVPMPTVDPGDTATPWVVCFSASWLPWVLGAISALARAETYLADDEASMVLAVERGYELLNLFMEGCTVSGSTILRREVNNCGIDWSTDGGLTWNTIDLVDCIASVAQLEIQHAILDGQVVQPGLQPIQPPVINPGECVTYHAAYDAAGSWLLPCQLSSGDTVEVKNWKGSWSPNFEGNDTFPYWYCPTGQAYHLGLCDVYIPAQPSDPFQGAWHMENVLQVGTQVMLPMRGAMTVPGGISNLDARFVPNYDRAPLGWGSIEFDVEVCRGMPSVGVTANPGSGTTCPASVNYGQIFTIQLNYNTGWYEWGGVTFDRPVLLEIMADAGGHAYFSEQSNTQSGVYNLGAGNEHQMGFQEWLSGVYQTPVTRVDLNGVPFPSVVHMRITPA